MENELRIRGAIIDVSKGREERERLVSSLGELAAMIKSKIRVEEGGGKARLGFCRVRQRDRSYLLVGDKWWVEDSLRRCKGGKMEDGGDFRVEEIDGGGTRITIEGRPWFLGGASVDEEARRETGRGLAELFRVNMIPGEIHVLSPQTDKSQES